MEIIFHSRANKTHFHKKGCAPSLILKVRVFGTRKWPIDQAAKILKPGRLFDFFVRWNSAIMKWCIHQFYLSRLSLASYISAPPTA